MNFGPSGSSAMMPKQAARAASNAAARLSDAPTMLRWACFCQETRGGDGRDCGLECRTSSSKFGTVGTLGLPIPHRTCAAEPPLAALRLLFYLAYPRERNGQLSKYLRPKARPGGAALQGRQLCATVKHYYATPGLLVVSRSIYNSFIRRGVGGGLPRPRLASRGPHACRASRLLLGTLRSLSPPPCPVPTFPFNSHSRSIPWVSSWFDDASAV